MPSVASDTVLRTVWYRNPWRADVRCHLVVPPTLSAASRIVVVLHGTERNPEVYRASWTDWACRNDRLVICPHFDRDGWPGAAGYVLGGVLYANGVPRPEASWAYTALSGIVARVRASFGLADEWFDLWGHSAGAQFVHRYLLFAPEAPVRWAIAANAGWYTLPDPEVAFPYGLAHLALELSAQRWTSRPLVLMRGDRDTSRDATLRVTEEADHQGLHRFDRAATMYRAGRLLDPGCRWRLIDVAGVGHEFAGMAPAAQAFLENPAPPSHESRLINGSPTTHAPTEV